MNKRTDAYEGFVGQHWKDAICVKEFITDNYTPYDGDEAFLAKPTARTARLMGRYTALVQLEKERGGVLDIDTDRVSSLTTYEAGYLDQKDELIVGLQTDAPLKRGVNPFGGLRMAVSACKAYGYEVGQAVLDHFQYKSTHNDGVFRVYTEDMRRVRHHGVLTGLPDAYGRGRIIGDYRRVALYGVDRLIESKRADYAALELQDMDAPTIQLREELWKQIDFLHKLKEMAALYGIDISKPALDTREAVQWLYFGYLGAIKEQNGAAMSLGRTSTFLDIYASRDLRDGVYTEAEIQELVDQFVLKLRMARQLRTPEYNELFAGDPTWVTESLAGIGVDGRHMVTKMSFRFLHTLYNLGSNPEPNLTVLWSKDLPDAFKTFCAKVSTDTSSIQYENDDIMRPDFGSDYGIACCVSAMRIGEQMQYFGARCNLPKILLFAINGGRSEQTGEQIAPIDDVLSGLLDYDTVHERLLRYIDWIAKLYVNTMNVIHFMHDKYAYEKLQLALHDTEVERLMAFGIAGLSVVADSLAAIKYAKVTAQVGDNGVVNGYAIDGDFPKFGNDDPRVDEIASELVSYFIDALRKTKTIRNAVHTLSLLTITSNVVYGKKTGATPDGRPAGAPFAPGANPMHNRDRSGAVASLNSVASLPYDCCRDGISNTFSITPTTLGKSRGERLDNLVDILDGYFQKGAHHLNVNVYSRQDLLDAQQDPSKNPTLTVRVSGYAVRFNSLREGHQNEVIARTFH